MACTREVVGHKPSPTCPTLLVTGDEARRGNVNRKRFLNLLKVAVSVSLIGLLLKGIGVERTVGVLATANGYYLLAAFAVFLAGVVLRAYRWQTLLAALGVRMPIRELGELYFIGFLFNNVLPSGFGGDAVKMYELSKSSHQTAASVSTVVVDRFMGLVALEIFALGAILFAGRLFDPAVVWVTVAFLAASLAGVWLLLNRGLWQAVGHRFKFVRFVGQVKTIRELYESLHTYGKRAIGTALGVSLVFDVMLVTVNYLVALAFRQHISFWYFVLFVPIVSFMTLFPSINGIGVRDFGYVYFYAQARVPDNVAFSMSLMILSMTIGAGLIGGVFYVLRGTAGLSGDRGERP